MTAPRSAPVVTHMRCNQNCGYCDRRSPVDDLAFIRADAVRGRIDAALAGGAHEIVLTGGEPTLRGDLPELVAHARARGAEQVALETNATLIDPERARALRAAGLTSARVNLAGASPELDQITRDPGGFERTLAGLAALAGAGVPLQVVATLVRSTAALLPELPALLEARQIAVGAIELVVPVEGPEPAELLGYPEAVPVVHALEAAARARGIPVRMSPGDGIVPCLFAPPARLQHLYSFTPGRHKQPAHTQPAPCTRCLIADRCSGLPDAYLRRRPVPPMHPITEERARRRLSMVATVPEQIALELVSRSVRADEHGAPAWDEIVRINFHCNQACTFCFVSTHLPPASDDQVAARIREAGARGSRIVISGGEPTLNARLVEYVQLAKSVSRHPVTLQTNAVRLDHAPLAEGLAAAGLDEAFVSLHGTTAEVSDLVTEAPGTFVRTLVGIDHLRQAGVRVILNFVICDANRHQSPELVRLVAARWPGTPINFSFVAASTDVVPRDRRLIPRYSDALPPLGEAAAEAARLSIPLVGFESMCGLPLCLVPQSLEPLKLTALPTDFDRGEFLHAEACQQCRYQSTCWGVRRGYAELYGTSELRTMR